MVDWGPYARLISTSAESDRRRDMGPGRSQWRHRACWPFVWLTDTDVFLPLLDLHPEAESERRAYLVARSPASHEDDLLTVTEAAAKWKINPETVRRWIREKRIPQAAKFWA